MKKIAAALLALILALTAVSALAEDGTLLLTVNGLEILDTDPGIAFWKKNVTEYYGLDETAAAQYDQDLSIMALAYALDYYVAETELAATEYAVTDAKIREAMELVWANAVDSYTSGITESSTEEEIAAAKQEAEAYILSNFGYTKESFLDNAGEQYATKVDLINDCLHSYYLPETIEVTEEEIQEYYRQAVESDRQAIEYYAGMYGMTAVDVYNVYPYLAGRESYYRPEGFRAVNHILLPVDEELKNAYTDLKSKLASQQAAAESAEPAENTETAETTETPEEIVTQEMVDAAAQAVLDSVAEKVAEIKEKLAGGASFEDLIAEYGTDPGMDDEAKRAEGYMVHANSSEYDPAFHQAAMALEKIGDISEPVLSNFGVHILKYVRDVSGGAIAMPEAARAEMTAGAQNTKANLILGALIAEWTEQSDIAWTQAGEAWKPQAAN